MTLAKVRKIEPKDDDSELRLADDASQDRHVEDRAEGRDRHHGDGKGQPVVEAPPDDRHVADERA